MKAPIEYVHKVVIVVYSGAELVRLAGGVTVEWNGDTMVLLRAGVTVGVVTLTGALIVVLRSGAIVVVVLEYGGMVVMFVTIMLVFMEMIVVEVEFVTLGARVGDGVGMEKVVIFQVLIAE